MDLRSDLLTHRQLAMRHLLDRLNTRLGRPLPVVLQTEASECALASLAMVAQHFGHRTELADLRRKYPISLKGATLKDLIRIADQIGLAARPLRLELDELQKLRMPCILHWDLNHFVVLVTVGRNTAVIYDPAAGVRKLPLSKLS